MTNQSEKQASVRTVTSTALTYEGDWHALFDAASIDDGTFNERLLAWINLKLTPDVYTELNSAMAAYAAEVGVDNWDSIGAFDAS